MLRPYTGFDKNSTGALPGLKALRDVILYLNGGKITHLGSWTIRAMNGKPGVPSVHGTGRAVDLGYTYRKDIEGTITWLINNADALGVEFVADYYPTPYGRGWRCDRGVWKNYTSPTIKGAPGGKWIHLEISPTMANNKTAMDAAIVKTFCP
jgi:hypothetical protein